MAKGQKRSNRELKKPKMKKEPPPAANNKFVQGSATPILSAFKKKV
jgi:hypothetical protein